jgi:hypothetical protein
MLDVHPPEHVAHTWRDFLIHIATICVGLLIAIGLEQSVEAIHHRHELRDFREAMASDSEKTKLDATHMEAAETLQFHWLLQRQKQVNPAIAQHQPLPSLPVPQFPPYDYPASPTWKAAKTSGLLALMPQEEIKAYSEAEDIMSNVYISWRDSIVAHSARRTFEVQFAGTFTSTDTSLPNATPADLIEYQRLLRNEIAPTASARNELRYLLGAETAILHGARALDEIQQEEKQVVGPNDD